MSFDQYQFHMVLRQEQMTRADRLAADEQAGRIAQAVWRLWTAAARALRPTPRRAAALQLRRNP
jgi:hypothetical protein